MVSGISWESCTTIDGETVQKPPLQLGAAMCHRSHQHMRSEEVPGSYRPCPEIPPRLLFLVSVKSEHLVDSMALGGGGAKRMEEELGSLSYYMEGGTSQQWELEMHP